MGVRLSLRASTIAVAGCALAIGLLAAAGASAEDRPLKIGLIEPMTGPFASTGAETVAAVKLYMAQHGDTVAGRKIEVLIRDDTGLAPDITKRFAQQLITNDHAEIIAGFGLTPLAFAAAPVATAAKVPMIVMNAGSLSVPQKSPYILRTSFSLVQYSAPMGTWEAKHGFKKLLTLGTDYAPGLDSEKAFSAAFKAAGGTIVDNMRMPLQNPDYGPFVQRAKDTHPDAVFAFVPSGEGAALMKQFAERGLTKAGIKLTGTGDVPDDNILNSMGDLALGMITSGIYSAAHDSPENKAYVKAFEKANPNRRPNFMSVGGYDGMNLIYEVLKKTNGSAEGDKFVAAAKGLAWVSPRGPISIDPVTRDITQNVYVSKVERKNGQLYNVEFETLGAFKADGTPAKK